MKKILAALLAVLMIMTVFAACTEQPEVTTPNDNGGIPGPDGNGTGDGNGDGNGNGTGDGNGTGTGTTEEITFEDRDETVYVAEFVDGNPVGALNLRANTSFEEDNVKVQVDAGAELKRTGYHATWSRVEYNGETYYCSTRYLTTSAPVDISSIVFTDVEEDMYILPEGAARYYSKPIQNDEGTYVAGFLSHGTLVKRTGVYYETENDPEMLGWSRIDIDGTAFYIRNSVLTATKPEETPEA